jgi:uncharacterized protein (UPF0335 family)
MNPNVKKYFEQLVGFYQEIEMINENIKDVKSSLKDMELDSALIAKIAKAQAQSKVQDLEESSKALLDLISEVTS